MKTKLLSTILVAGLWAGSGSAGLAQQVQFSQLPAAVQETINVKAGPAGIASIERTERNGIPVYEVRLSQRNTQPFFVSESGTLLNLSNVVGRRAQDGTRKGHFSELPSAVQNAVRAQAGNSPIEDIDVVTKDGRTLYDVAFKRDGRTVELWVDPNGNILKGGHSAAQLETASTGGQRTPLAAASKVTENDLPEAVRNTLRQYTQGSRIEDIDKGTLRGKTVYEAGFKHHGEHVELRVAEDGSLVSDDVNHRFLAAFGPTPGDSVVSRAATTDWRTAPARVPLSGASKVSFRDLPNEVRNTLRQYAGTTRIDDVDRGSIGGMTVYQAAFRHRGQNMELQVAENGELINDQVNQRFLADFGRQVPRGPVGSAPSWETLRGGESTPAQPSNLRRVDYNQVPAAVQSTLRAQAGLSAIQNLRQGRLNDRTVYQATFQRDGRDVQVVVLEDGSIVRLQ